jgi:hypothetical protein
MKYKTGDAGVWCIGKGEQTFCGSKQEDDVPPPLGSFRKSLLIPTGLGILWVGFQQYLELVLVSVSSVLQVQKPMELVMGGKIL